MIDARLDAKLEPIKQDLATVKAEQQEQGKQQKRMSKKLNKIAQEACSKLLDDAHG